MTAAQESQSPEMLPDAVHTACALCGTRDATPLHRDCVDRRHWLPGIFDVVRCANCGLVRTDPAPTERTLSSYYPPSYCCFAAEPSPAGGWYGALRWIVRLPFRLRYGSPDALPPPPAPGAKVLDIGCGTGVLLKRLASLGWEPWGLEPDADTAATAARLLALDESRIVPSRVEEARLPANTFDLITMSHVLEHLPDPLQALERARQWLRPGASIRIWVPNVASLESRLFGRRWFCLDVPRHLQHFEPNTLSLLLRRAGFTVERIRPQYQGAGLSGSLQHVADDLLGRRRDFQLARGLYFAVLPLASVSGSLGADGCIDVTVRETASGTSASAH
jgi:2-polyprenyl-3-methyl-5-hydroxy-6-metoxy-1,4-benzoquinol methylase